MSAFNAYKGKYAIFPNFSTYCHWVIDNLITEPLIRDHPFYKKLITWVLINKSPVFFRQDIPEERATFTGCYNISPVPSREGRYENDAIFTLFFLHELTHQLFAYVRSVNGVNETVFNEQMSLVERISSNESEFWVYVRTPGLRAKTRDILPRIWFDKMSENPELMEKLNIGTLEEYRRAWLSNSAYDAIFAPGKEDQPILDYMRPFRHGNKDFLIERLAKLMTLPPLAEPSFRALQPYTYKAALEEYIIPDLNSTEVQKSYEANTLEHVQLMYRLMGRTDFPKTFLEIFDRLDEMNDFFLLVPSN